MKPATLSCGVLAAMLALSASPIAGQRIQFPSALPTNTAAAPAYGATPGAASPYGASAAPVSPPAAMPSYGAGAAPAYLFSNKFLKDHGGWSSVVWVSPKVAELASDLYRAPAE